MSSEDRRFGRQSNLQENGAGGDGDDEFGDFEGFEGAALDSIPAAAGPSPWATFPDLLPVQTSPATTGSDEPGSSQIARVTDCHDHEPWLAGSSTSGQRASGDSLPNVAHDGVHGHFNQPRTVNPPDVSLSAYQPTFNSVEQACGSGLSHGQSGDDALPEFNSQLASLQRQLDAALQQKHQLQLQMDQLAREKTHLQQIVSTSHTESTNLRVQVIELQQQLAQVSVNSHSASSQDIVPILQQLQEALTVANDAHTKETNSLREAVEETRGSMEQKVNGLEKDLAELRDRLEKQHFVEDTGRFEAVVTSVVQDCFKQNWESLAQIVISTLSEVVRNQGFSNQDGVMQHFQRELQRHLDQTRRLLERERQQNLWSLAQGLQAALKQFSAAIEPTVNDHNEISGDDEKS